MTLCVCCLTADAQDEPRITMEIWPEIKRVGMTGYLNCTVTRQSNNKVSIRLQCSVSHNTVTTVTVTTRSLCMV